MKGVILQKGAFNPIHKMHVKIAEDVKKHYPKYHHAFILSSHTCDKGIISTSDLEKRAKLIEAEGYDVAYTKSGLFLDNIQEVRDVLGEHAEIVFPVGEDTVYRFFRDWDAYYNDNYPDEYLRRYEDYKAKFQNVTWHISKRECKERDEFKVMTFRYFAEHDNYTSSSLDLDDISSTKIREDERSVKER